MIKKHHFVNELLIGELPSCNWKSSSSEIAAWCELSEESADTAIGRKVGVFNMYTSTHLHTFPSEGLKGYNRLFTQRMLSAGIEETIAISNGS